MEIKLSDKVGSAVRQNFNAAKLFDSHGIDFCCGGDISIELACEKAGVNANSLLSELNELLKSSDADSKYIDDLELDELCDYIVKRHHTYVKENIPFITQKLEKICKVHGENHPELFQVQIEFLEAAKNLSIHLVAEEEQFFPYVKYLTGRAYRPKSSDISISQLKEEHEAEGDRFVRISAITNGYKVPADVCETYKITFKALQDFENDLHRHVHLENNILFVKALKLEQLKK